MINLSLALKQEMMIAGGVTASVLPKVEAWLEESADHWSALEFVAARKDMDRYWSVLDFLLCEICPEERPACLRFYADSFNAPRLVDLRTEKQIACYEAKILVFLEICYAARCEERRLSWKKAIHILTGVEEAIR